MGFKQKVFVKLYKENPETLFAAALALIGIGIK